MKTTKEQIIADITAKVEAKLASHKIELATLDEIKTASESVKKQYDSVFQKAMTALSNVNEGVKIGNKAFFDAQKFYQQGVKIFTIRRRTNC